jgi:hypothetical protein
MSANSTKFTLKQRFFSIADSQPELGSGGILTGAHNNSERILTSNLVTLGQEE